MLESADAVTKKQEELKELELKQAELDKEKSQAMGKSQKLKDEMSKLSARLDGLLRTQSLNKMQLRNIKNQIKQKIEETQLNMTFNLKEVGLEDNEVEVLQSQIYIHYLPEVFAQGPKDLHSPLLNFLSDR